LLERKKEIQRKEKKKERKGKRKKILGKEFGILLIDLKERRGEHWQTLAK